MWAQNSTPMPTQMTRLTREMALRETENKAMQPMTSTTIMATVRVTTRPVAMEPRSAEDRTKMMARAEPSRVPVSRIMEAYWSKKM